MKSEREQAQKSIAENREAFHDKRETIKRREADRETRAAVKERRR